MKLSLSTEWLFFHLWKKNPDTNSSCPGVFVADTIIYRWAQPYFWYFTAKDGQILRKTKERIFVEQIEEIFQKTGDISALYLQSQQNKIIFEYFEKGEFVQFLHQREKALNALLQKFVEPKSSRNSMIKVSWSPQFCLLSRKTNNNDLKNNKIPIEDRLVTFEGPEHLSTTDSIASPILSADIEQICLNIVKHIQDVSGGNIQISRMVLFFKIDEKNRLWLLFSSGVKVRQKFINEETVSDFPKQKERIQSPIMILQTQLKIGQTSKFSVDTQGFVKQTGSSCNNCSLQGEMYELTVQQYIASYDQGIFDEETLIIRQKVAKNPVKKSDNEEDYYVEGSLNIPGLLLKIWGKMDIEKYKNLRNNMSFMNLKLQLCLDCYLKFTRIHVESKSEREAKQKIVSIPPLWQPSKTKIQNNQETLTLVSSTKQNKMYHTPAKQVQQPSFQQQQKQQSQYQSQQQLQQQQSQQSQLTIQQQPQSSIVIPKLNLPSKDISERVIATTHHTDRQSNFPSKRVAKIYNNLQGVSLPHSQSSLNTTRSTYTHSQRIVSIQQLKEILQTEQL
ncbi:unnamed protein product [Paramecium primaurelia]|uniref:Uncharacterized protein n=1 Tax=Paramecium primaurelia TaxID=5886 RepID=A0A8S1NR57_PARPR|nr:unnamed protein product [Paramecium primaurelia]